MTDLSDLREVEAWVRAVLRRSFRCMADAQVSAAD